jgi:hypothetical protein
MQTRAASDSTGLVGTVREELAAGTFGKGIRIVLLSVYAVLTLPAIPLLAMMANLKSLLLIDLSVRAVPLYLTWFVDSNFLDGGEVTPHLMPLWVLLTGVMLWPLLALGVRPRIWASNTWRRAMAAYGAVMLTATIGAVYWVFTHVGIFF